MRRQWIILAMFLAIALMVQSIRLFIPMIPGPVNMLWIGSLLNMVMVLSIWKTGSRWAAIIGALLPIGAFLQGQLPIVLMMPVVACGNSVFTIWAGFFRRSWLLYLGPFVKAAILYGGTAMVVRAMELPEAVTAMLLVMMSWPQILTGTIGILLAQRVSHKILTSL